MRCSQDSRPRTSSPNPRTWSSSRRCGEMPAACPAPRGCGNNGLLLLALAGRVEDDLPQLTPNGKLTVIDEQLAADAIREEQEAQLVHRSRVLAIGARLEVADGHRPGRQLIELLGVLHLPQPPVAAGWPAR